MQKDPVTKFRNYIHSNRLTTFLYSAAAVVENKSLQRTPVCCHELSKYYIVICVLASESASSIIIGIAVSSRTVALEVYSRRAALAHIWIIEFTTTAVLIGIVGQTRALACYHVAAKPDFQIIRTSRVEINGTTSRGAEVSASTSYSRCHLQRISWPAWHLSLLRITWADMQLLYIVLWDKKPRSSRKTYWSNNTMKLGFSWKSRRSFKNEVLSPKLWKTNVHYRPHKTLVYSYRSCFFYSMLKTEYTLKQISYAILIYPKNLLTRAGTLKPSTKLTS